MRTLFSFLVVLFFISYIHLRAQAIYFHHAVYRLPDAKPFIETYMAVDGKYFPLTKTADNQYQVKVPFRVLHKTHLQPEKIINQYLLSSPKFSDTNNIPVFLDVQRYPLPAGEQKMVIQLMDEKNQKVLNEYAIPLTLEARPKTFEISDLEWVEKFTKSNNTSSPFYKSGYEIYPYLVNYLPEKINNLNFYVETYCFSMTTPSLLVEYALVDADDYSPVKGFLKKIPWNNPSMPLPIPGRFDISALPTGNYFLQVKIKNMNDSVLNKREFFFQRKNFFHKKVSFEGTSVSIEKYIRQIRNFDTLYMHIECLYPISSEIEKERQFNHLKTKDTANMKNYLVHFWTKRANDTINPYTICKNYMRQVYEANALFRCGKQKGYNTEQGRVYLQYGKPSQVAAMYNEANTYPYEIWHYYRSFDQTEQRYVTNRRFVFVNNNLADNCFRLVHSDMRGEINNERWRYDVMKRFNNGIQNDSNIPVESQNSQMNDLFLNPR